MQAETHVLIGLGPREQGGRRERGAGRQQGDDVEGDVGKEPQTDRHAEQ